jgi:hypothetical protein
MESETESRKEMEQESNTEGSENGDTKRYWTDIKYGLTQL